MTEIKKYDLEDRTLLFAKAVNKFIFSLPKSVTNIENCKQLARSAGSVGANYIEANESLSKKDFVMRIKICRKEAKESRFWLNLLTVSDVQEQSRLQLIDESTQLLKILNSIIEKSK